MNSREKTSSAAGGPLDDFWMTPVMGLRMRFDFTKSVIEMTRTTEEKRRAAGASPLQSEPEQETPETPAAPKDAKPEISLPPIPPPLRLLRY